MEVGAIALDSEGGGYSSTPTVAFAGGGCSWDSTAESNILTDDFCWNESGGTCASTGSPTDPATGAALTSYAATDITTGGTTSFLNYYHPLRIEAQRYCNSTCSSCGQSTTSGDTYMLIRAFLDCDDGALGGTTGQHTLCQSLTTQYLTGSGAVFPFSSSSGYSGAYTVNYCVIDPGANSALGITAFDSVYMGITVGAGSAQTGLLIRNFSPSIISSTTN